MADPVGRRQTVGALAALVGVLAVVHHPLLAGRAIFARDMIRWVLPARSLVRAALAQHHLPLWNSMEGIGFPIPSDPLYGVFYPPALATLALPLVAGTMVFMALHLVWGALGTMLVARRFGASVYGVLVAGLAWSLSGSIASEWTSGIRLLSSAWVPWAALAGTIMADRTIARAPRLWAVGALAAIPSAAVFLAGEVLLAVVVAGFGAVVGLGVVITTTSTEGRRSLLLRYGWAACVALALAPLCGAVSLLPAAAAAVSTVRAAPLDHARADRVSIRPSRLVEFAAPDSLGHAYDVTDNADVVHYFPNPPLSFSIYVGASVLTLALLGLSRRREVVVVAVLALLAVCLAMGPATPLHGVLRFVVRPLAYMRSPEKYLTLAIPLVSVLAALGADALVREARWRARLIVLPVALLAVYLAARWLYLPSVAPFVAAGALRGAVAAAALLVVPWIARKDKRAASAAIVAIVAVDLGSHVHHQHVYVSAAEITAMPALAEAVLRDARSVAPAPPRVYRAPALDNVLVGAPGLRPTQMVTRSLEDNSSVLHGVGILPGYDAAIPSALQALLATGRRDALRLLAVDHALLTVPAGAAPDAYRSGFVTVGAPFPRVRLYRVEHTLPRAYLAGGVGGIDADADPVTLLRPEVVEGQVALATLRRGERHAPPEAAPRTDCMVERYAPGDITVRCGVDRDRMAVIVEQSAPGWEATVNGVRTPWQTVNLVAMGVWVHPGTQRIRMHYRPPWLAEAALLSMLGWLGVAAAARRSLRSRTSV